jgi:hypothetical protein
MWPKDTSANSNTTRDGTRPRVPSSELVAELPKQILPPRDVILALDPLRSEPVDCAEQRINGVWKIMNKSATHSVGKGMLGRQ